MPTYFGGMIAARFIVAAVVKEATHLLNAELSRYAVHNVRRHLGEVFEERTEETSGAKLDRETETTVIAAVEVDDAAIRIIEIEVPVQLFLSGFANEAAIPEPLVIVQEADGHASPIPGEALFAKLTSSAKQPELRFSWIYRFAKVCGKR